MARSRRWKSEALTPQVPLYLAAIALSQQQILDRNTDNNTTKKSLGTTSMGYGSTRYIVEKVWKAIAE